MTVLPLVSRRGPSSKLIITHPLLINAVMEKIFSFFGLDALKEYRFVNKVWSIEAFRVMRLLSYVEISTRERQKDFLSSGVAESFNRFEFRAYNMDEKLVEYFKTTPPSLLDVSINLILKNDDNYDNEYNYMKFERNLLSQADTLINLVINVSCNMKHTLAIPDAETDHSTKLKKLKRLTIISGNRDLSELQGLWVSIVQNSPALEAVGFKDFACEDLWVELREKHCLDKLAELGYMHGVHNSTFIMHQTILRVGIPTTITRLCIPFKDSYSGAIIAILRKLATSLEILELFAEDEKTTLSPINFPFLPRLKILDSGSSLISFSSVTFGKFPRLTELRTTYWNWIEHRVVVHDHDYDYHWRTNFPHTGVMDITIRFPDWPNIPYNEDKLENFATFSEVLNAKFPAAKNFVFENVSLAVEQMEALQYFVQIVEFHCKSIEIASYYNAKVYDPLPLQIGVTRNSNRNRALDYLDLRPKVWPAVWKRVPHMLSAIPDDWIPNLMYFKRLRVLKLLWSKNLFTLLGLEDVKVLPNLELLEYVGNKCVDRFQRRRVRLLRPKLIIREHKDCRCDCDDWWYNRDTGSGTVFRNLFNNHD